MIDTQLLQQLRALIGKPVEHDGRACCVIEVLDSEQLLVVRCEDNQTVIQGNQFGEAARRVQQCHTLPLFNAHGELDAVISGWLSG